MVRLDLRRDAVVRAARLDDVRVQRPLDEETDVAELRRLLLEDADELLAHDRPLLLGIGDAGEPVEEAPLRLHVHERHAEVAGEGLHDLLGFVLAQETVVDEDAGELVADCLVHEQCRDRGVDAARERAEDALVPDYRSDALDLLLDDRCRRPRRRDVRDLVQEVLEDVLAVRRVDDLGVELHAVQPPCAILERGDRRRGRRRGDDRAHRRRGHRVAVAHPDGLLRRKVVEELGLARLELGLPELGDPGTVDGTAEVARHQLHAVADAERRNAEQEDRGIYLRGAVRVHGGRPAGEDERCRIARCDLTRGEPVADQLRVDARLAHATCDELAVLPA